MSITIGVPKEIAPGERRVAMIPDFVDRLAKLGCEVVVEKGAGVAASYPDAAYVDAGATLVDDPETLYGRSDVVLKVRKPQQHETLQRHEIDFLKEGSVLVGFLDPLRDSELVERLAARKVTSISMEAIPRITRAQTMDALSSQATIAGYKAVLLAANALGKFLPMLVTAAGTIPPAQAFVLGAGVAGLQAIATLRRLGAVVEAFDVRPAVREQVESLGAKFLEIELEGGEGEGGYAKELSEEAQKKEQELIHQHARDADVIITTAQIPGKPAPRIITKEMVQDMKPGSVIVDLAAEGGGNCELTEPDREIVHEGVTILGPTNLPATMPIHASRMYARNLISLLELFVKEQAIQLDLDDDILKEACITHEGKVVSALLARVSSG